MLVLKREWLSLFQFVFMIITQFSVQCILIVMNVDTKTNLYDTYMNFWWVFLVAVDFRVEVTWSKAMYWREVPT